MFLNASTFSQQALTNININFWVGGGSTQSMIWGQGCPM